MYPSGRWPYASDGNGIGLAGSKSVAELNMLIDVLLL